jgi:hypothetical protein
MLSIRNACSSSIKILVKFLSTNSFQIPQRLMSPLRGQRYRSYYSPRNSHLSKRGFPLGGLLLRRQGRQRKALVAREATSHAFLPGCRGRKGGGNWCHHYYYYYYLKYHNKRYGFLIHIEIQKCIVLIHILFHSSKLYHNHEFQTHIVY